MKRPKKAVDRVVTPEFLAERAKFAKSLGFPKQQWVLFCEALLNRGYTMTLYEAKQTVSKYITVRRDNKKFKVRFSDHKPIARRELTGDCDFFVGVTHLGVTTAEQAYHATRKYFEGRRRPQE